MVNQYQIICLKIYKLKVYFIKTRFQDTCLLLIWQQYKHGIETIVKYFGYKTEKD